MATIGTFTTSDHGFLKGQIRTLNLDASVSMEPVNSDKEGAPAYRLFAGAVELGAAWAKTGKESGRLYHQVRIDDPSLPAPIFANLVEDRDTRRLRPDLEPAEAPRQAPGRPPTPDPPVAAHKPRPGHHARAGQTFLSPVRG